jgi:Ni/Co efflux regulator RcnB
MRGTAVGTFVGAAALALIGATGAAAQTAGVAGNDGRWVAVPDRDLSPPRGSSWGPSGYRGGDIHAPAPVPVRSDALPVRNIDDLYSDETVTVGAAWDDAGDADGDMAAGGYQRVGRGFVVPNYLRTSAYLVTDWRGYGLPRPGYGLRWVRYYDDALLIDGTGRVQDTRSGIDWDHDGRATTYADDTVYQQGNYDTGFVTQGAAMNDDVQVYRSGPDAPNVSVHRNADGSTTVVVRNEPQVTTTTRYVPAPPPVPVYMAQRR